MRYAEWGLCLFAGCVAGWLFGERPEFLRGVPWLQSLTAVATASAVGVALWQSQAAHKREDARINRESEKDLVKARLLAQRIRLALTMASGDLDKLVDLFERAHDDYNLAPSLTNVEWLLNSIRREIGDPDLVALYPLSAECASGLAEVIGTLDWHIRIQKQTLPRLPVMSVREKYAHLHLSEGTLMAASVTLKAIWGRYQRVTLGDAR